MQTRILGNGDPELTVIGLGAWVLGGSWKFGWGTVDGKESIKTIGVERVRDLAGIVVQRFPIF